MSGTPESWWLLLVALLALAAGLVVALRSTGKALSQGDKPDPATAARLEETHERGDPDDGGGDDEPRIAV